MGDFERVRVFFDGEQKDCFKIKIRAEKYLECEIGSHNKWCSGKKGEFGRGLINSKKDRRRVERIGNLGEMAFGNIFNAKPDFSYKKGGDKYDFLFCNKKIDVKIASKPSKHHYGLIRSYPDQKAFRDGILMHLKADVYVFGYLYYENIKEKYAEVILVGWMEKKDVERCEIKKGIIGKHYNYEVPFKDLEDLDFLGGCLYNLTDTRK